MPFTLLANWKLNGSKSFSQAWLKDFFANYTGIEISSIGIAPPSILIDELVQNPENLGIAIGSQNIDQFLLGARTGEISASMVKDAGGAFSIIGHSERRILFQETNGDISLKLDLASECKLTPIFCIGESNDEKQQNKTKDVLKNQIIEVLSHCSKVQGLIIAYEPVWAIGSGDTPEPKEINSIHEMIKDIVQSHFSKLDLQAVLYGGSVNIENSTSIFKEKEVDGALVGGCSLKGKDFAILANIFNKTKGL